MKRILLGLTGSVASILYKKIIEQLQTIGQVDVILTPSANHFVNDLDIPKLLKGGKLYQDKDEWEWNIKGGITTEWKKDYPVLHIELRNNHSAFVIAPCSVNTLAKIANGICDNLLTSVAKAWDRNRPFIIAPAANTHMMRHSTTGEHLLKFIRFSKNNANIPTQEKMLACGTFGDGAMGEIDDIVNTTKEMLIWSFPLKKCNGIPINNHSGSFGVVRKHEKHTGIDLYCNDKDFVRAVEDGTIVYIGPFTGTKTNSPWWNDTDCLLVEGASGVICYGEINLRGLSVGNNIQKEQFLGYVKRVIPEGKEHYEIPGWQPSMLHIELYPHGNYKPSEGFNENILIDPTPYLIESNKNTFPLLNPSTVDI